MFRPLALTAAAVMLTAAGAQAGSINFLPNGDNSVVVQNWFGFDPAPGNVLNVGGQTAVNNWVASGGANPEPFISFGQANVLTALTDNGAVNIPGGYTAVFGLSERVVNVTGAIGQAGSSVQFDINPNGSVNYVEFYRTGTGGNDLAGTGFNNGTLVLRAQVTGLDDPTAPGGGTVGQLTNVPLDQFGLNNDYPNNNSVTLTGAINLVGTITYFNPAFFQFTDPKDTLLGGTMSLTTQLILAFGQVNPSAAFLVNTVGTAQGGIPVTSGAGLGPNTTDLYGIGTVNGSGDGQSSQIQTDANVTFTPTQVPIVCVPEPVSFAVFAGVLGMGGLVARRRRVKIG